MVECRFITVEDNPPELIVSLSCAREIHDQENDLLILRTPAYEPLRAEEERGAGLSVGYSDDRSARLEWVRVNGDTIAFNASPLYEERDCHRLDPDEWCEALRLL